jgi:hypothetical protein
LPPVAQEEEGISTMKTLTIPTAALLAAVLVATPVLAVAAHTIPSEKVDRQKIFWGNAESFEKPGEVNYAEVIKSTPEYDELRKKKIDRGTARYYYLMSQASERAVRVIVDVGRQTDFDLVAAKGYLASLDEPIEAPDLTEIVLERLQNGGSSEDTNDSANRTRAGEE